MTCCRLRGIQYYSGRNHSMPKIVDHDEYRKELLEKCFTLFTRKGYSGVTMREIAREIEVSTGTLYHYFPTKENILEEMFAYVQETNVRDYMSRTKNVESIEERIELFGEAWKKYGEYYQNVFLLSVDMFRNDGSGKYEKIFQGFSEYYTNAMVERLNFTPQFAKTLFIYLMGLVLHAMLTPNYFSFDEQIDVLIKMLKAAIVEGAVEDASVADSLKEKIYTFIVTNVMRGNSAQS